MRTKTSLFAIIGVMSVVGATSAFGAATVRTLGGAGTYTGVSSAVAAKNSGTTSGTATTRSRAGAIRVVPSVSTVSSTSSGTKTTKTITPTVSTTSGTVVSSGNDGADARMSIGKYLNGSALISSGKTSSSTTSGVAEAMVRDLNSDVEILKQQIAGHDTDISTLNGLVSGLENDVGDTNSGLIKQVNDLSDIVGDDRSGLTKDIADLSDTVGDGTSGLTKDVADLQDVIGDEETGGLLKRVKALENVSGGDLSEYATQSWIEQQGFVKQESLDGYATKDMLNNLPDAPSGEGSAGMYVLNKNANSATWEKVVVKKDWDE